MAHKLSDWLLDLLFPSRCVFCRQFLPPGPPRICERCNETLPRTSDGGRRRGDFFSECVSALYYEGAVREAIHRYKFEGAQAYAPAFGELLAACIYEDLEGEYDILSWVPLDPGRRRKRGYDQAELLARRVGELTGIPAAPLLEKTRQTGTQSRIEDEAERRANVAGVYRVLPDADVKGKRIVLVDDIVTSGATLAECAACLRDAGAGSVVALTLAKAR